jgi:hypothetical protein
MVLSRAKDARGKVSSVYWADRTEAVAESGERRSRTVHGMTNRGLQLKLMAPSALELLAQSPAGTEAETPLTARPIRAPPDLPYMTQLQMTAIWSENFPGLKQQRALRR